MVSTKQMVDGMGEYNISPNSLEASYLAASSVDSSELADGAIDAVHLSASCVTATAIADGTITATQLAASCVDSSEIADGAIDSDHFSAGCVNATAIGADAVGFTKLAKGYEASTVDVGVDGNGDGSASFAFSNTFASTPVVVPAFNESITTYRAINANTITATHCVVAVYGCEPTSATYSVGVVAYEK